MLILTRRTGESLRIGDDVEVTVMAVNGSQVRIGIKAPRNIAVDRSRGNRGTQTAGTRTRAVICVICPNSRGCLINPSPRNSQEFRAEFSRLL